MPGTNLFINWSGTTVTPTTPSGTAVAVDEVTDVMVDGSSVQEAFYGDNRKFAKLIVNKQKTRSITIVGGNVGKLSAIPEDAECTIVTTLCDAQNGTGSGALTVTAVRAVRAKGGFGGQNNKFASSSMTFNCAGDSTGGGDGDPITYAVAT